MKIHPHDQRLRKLLHSDQDKTDPVREHVSGCTRCRRRLEGLQERKELYAAYDAALSSSARRISDLQAAYEKERAAAKGLVAELTRHPAERQRILIRNHTRFHSWGVYELLLEASRQESSRNPELGEQLADLALDLSGHLDTSSYGAEAIEDLRARAWAYIGNARRVRSDLRGAQEAFDRALIHLRQGTREPWEQAAWLDLRASLLRAQRRFDDAMRLLNRALTLFLAVGDRHRAGRILVSMDIVHHQAGQPEKGIPLLYRSLVLLDSAQDPKLLFTAQHNLIDDLTEVGRFMEAQGLFIQARPLYLRFDEPRNRNRRRWVEGKIARGLGQPEKAVSLLLAARAGFLELDDAYDVALVSLDIASLYAEQGRMAELKQLAEEMVPIFSSRQIHREAIAAFALWQQAVQTERLGTELTARVVASLRQARYDQALRGQETL